jgi:hypothetical protein
MRRAASSGVVSSFADCAAVLDEILAPGIYGSRRCGVSIAANHQRELVCRRRGRVAGGGVCSELLEVPKGQARQTDRSPKDTCSDKLAGHELGSARPPALTRSGALSVLRAHVRSRPQNTQISGGAPILPVRRPLHLVVLRLSRPSCRQRPRGHVPPRVRSN